MGPDGACSSANGEPSGSRWVYLRSADEALRHEGVGAQLRAPVGPRAGLTVVNCRPAHSQSLYRLSYRGSEMPAHWRHLTARAARQLFCKVSPHCATEGCQMDREGSGRGTILRRWGRPALRVAMGLWEGQEATDWRRSSCGEQGNRTQRRLFSRYSLVIGNILYSHRITHRTLTGLATSGRERTPPARHTHGVTWPFPSSGQW
jgi:hypothetical protein